MDSNQERPNIEPWEKAGMILMIMASVVVLVWTISTWQSAPPQQQPRAEAPPAPQIETQLHDAGEGVTCWVLRRGETILGSGCLR
jgi:hypothetical protein